MSRLELLETIREVIDLRSFSNLWYWIGLAVIWSSTSHFVLGVPYDLITRAERQGGEVLVDLEDSVRVNVNRFLYVGRMAGHWLIGLAAMVFTMLAVLGWFYWVEFCQAVFLLLFPMIFVGMLSLHHAGRIENERPTGPDLFKLLHRHRVMTQGIGILSIFVTATWGMFMNLYVGPFGI
jgi:hypothetical protein